MFKLSDELLETITGGAGMDDVMSEFSTWAGKQSPTDKEALNFLRDSILRKQAGFSPEEQEKAGMILQELETALNSL